MSVSILTGDCRDALKTLPDESVHCVVTSPPYFGLRDYGVAGQIGLEATPDAFVQQMVAVFREAKRVLRDDGTLWLNLGDSYAGSRCGPQGALGEMADRSITSQRIMRSREGNHVARPGAKSKDLLMIPARVALALQADGWWLRSDIIWAKPNPMPESVTDRPTSAHEHVFLLAKSERYFFNADGVRESGCEPREFHEETRGNGSAALAQGRASRQATGPSGFGAVGTRNIRNVWTVATQPFGEAHFATFPPALIEPCIKAGCPVSGTVLDPFFGAGTTGLVADRLSRDCIGIELNPEYAAMARRRIENDAGMFADVGSAGHHFADVGPMVPSCPEAWPLEGEG